jgi:hypothetical protein
MEALQRIIKDRNHHASQYETNILKIKEKYEAIEALEQANIREQKLVEEYNRILVLIKADMNLSQSISIEKQLNNSIEEMNGNDNPSN